MADTTKKILIVEDEETLLRALEKKLRGHGYEVVLARNGDEGLKQVKDEHPDLVLLDILMPTTDGFAVLEQLKAEGITPDLPVIIISNSGQPVEIDRAIKLGARDYLVKAEFDPNEVVDKVHGVLGDSKTAAAGTTEKSKSKPKSAAPAAGKARILIVEDDQFLRELLERKLTSEGFIIETAIEGEAALQKVAASKPDLILLDIILPGIDGFSILERLKQSGDLAGIPVILLTNLGQRDDIEKGLKLGAVGYLVKAHFTPGDIVEKVKSTLNIT